jgi:hypothetical protein
MGIEALVTGIIVRAGCRVGEPIIRWPRRPEGAAATMLWLTTLPDDQLAGCFMVTSDCPGNSQQEGATT